MFSPYLRRVLASSGSAWFGDRDHVFLATDTAPPPVVHNLPAPHTAVSVPGRVPARARLPEEVGSWRS